MSTTFLALTSSDAGSLACTVTYASYPGEVATISGGVQVTGWSLCTDAGVCAGGAAGIYKASVTSPADFREAYFGGTHGTRSRGPSNPGGWTYNTGVNYTAPVNATTPTSTWTNVSDIEMVTLSGWQANYCPIATIVSTTVTLQNPCFTNAKNTFLPFSGSWLPAWIENAFDLLPTCGQGCWYLNKSTHVLYYIPRAGENMATLDVEVPGVVNLVTGNAVSNLSIERFVFEYTTYTDPDVGGMGMVETQGGYFCQASPPPEGCAPWNGGVGITLPAAVDFSNGSRLITVSHNKFTHLAGHAVYFEHGTQYSTIYANLCEDNAAGCIQIGEPTDYAQTNPLLKTGFITVKDNDCELIFEYLGSPNCVLSPVTTDTQIIHNVSNNGSETPFATGWWGWLPPTYTGFRVTYNANNVLENNKTTNACNVSTMVDCSDWYNNGTQSSSNFSNNYGLGLVARKEACIYPDNGSTGITYDSNVCDGPLTANGCTTGGASGGCFLFVNFSSASGFSVSNTYSSTSLYQLSGSSISVTGTTVIPVNSSTTGCNGNATCAAIVANAGVEAGVTPGP